MKFDIIVVGGGLVGYCFALDLATKSPKLSIAVLEHKEYITPNLNTLDSKIYAISPENISYLESLGILLDDSKLGVIKKMDVFGDLSSNIIFDNKIAKKLFLAKTIEYNYLQHNLYTQLQQLSNISFVYDNLTDIKYQENYITLFGIKKEYKATLVVGADGANSFVRSKSHIELQQITYPEYGVVANFECELPHKNTAYQWFTSRGVLAYLPLPKNQISIVWATKEHKALTSMSDNDFTNEVMRIGENKLGALKLITKPQAFPLRLYMLDKIYSKQIALIGDAAHTIHPLAGQGVNLGFADARVLANLLSKCEPYQLGDTAILRRYNNLRVGDIRRMQLVCHSLYRLFGYDNPLLKMIRNKGLNLVNFLSPLKKYLINET